jgi:hypothetical protein
MPNIKLAEKMLADLKVDFKSAWNNGGSIDVNLTSYKLKYSVSEEDIKAYCQTLTTLVPIHPVCIVCGNEWGGLEKIIKPINNGQHINWVDDFQMWCGNDRHGVIYYNQRGNNDVSFTREFKVDDRYSIRFNCNCMVDECKGKTVIVDENEDYDYKIIAIFENGIIPYNISEDKLKQYLIFQ